MKNKLLTVLASLEIIHKKICKREIMQKKKKKKKKKKEKRKEKVNNLNNRIQVTLY